MSSRGTAWRGGPGQQVLVAGRGAIPVGVPMGALPTQPLIPVNPKQ